MERLNIFSDDKRELHELIDYMQTNIKFYVNEPESDEEFIKLFKTDKEACFRMRLKEVYNVLKGTTRNLLINRTLTFNKACKLINGETSVADFAEYLEDKRIKEELKMHVRNAVLEKYGEIKMQEYLCMYLKRFVQWVNSLAQWLGLPKDATAENKLFAILVARSYTGKEDLDWRLYEIGFIMPREEDFYYRDFLVSDFDREVFDRGFTGNIKTLYGDVVNLEDISSMGLNVVIDFKNLFNSLITNNKEVLDLLGIQIISGFAAMKFDYLKDNIKPMILRERFLRVSMFLTLQDLTAKEILELDENSVSRLKGHIACCLRRLGLKLKRNKSTI